MLVFLIAVVNYTAYGFIALLFIRALLTRFVHQESGPLFQLVKFAIIVTNPLVKPVDKLCKSAVPATVNLTYFLSFIVVIIIRTVLLWIIYFLQPVLL